MICRSAGRLPKFRALILSSAPRSCPMASETVKFEIAAGIATVTLNDPATMNAFTSEMGDALLEAFTHIGDPASGVRVAILTGTGRAFCTGVNLAVRARQLKEEGGVDLGFN